MKKPIRLTRPPLVPVTTEPSTVRRKLLDILGGNYHPDEMLFRLELLVVKEKALSTLGAERTRRQANEP